MIARIPQDPSTTAPDESWHHRGDPWPETDVMVEVCWASRKESPPRYDFGRAWLKQRWPDGMSEWLNTKGETMAFNPDFWRPMPSTPNKEPA